MSSLHAQAPHASCSFFHFALQIKGKDGGEPIGCISKQWSGLVNEAFTDKDNFGIRFPMDLDAKLKAVLLGTCFLIVRHVALLRCVLSIYSLADKSCAFLVLCRISCTSRWQEIPTNATLLYKREKQCYMICPPPMWSVFFYILCLSIVSAPDLQVFNLE